MKNLKLVSDMKYLREITERGHSVRKERQIPLKQPLQSIKVASPKAKLGNEILSLIKDELNVKEVIWKKAKTVKVSFNTELTQELIEEAKTRELIRKVQVERKNKKMGLADKIKLTSDWFPTDNKMIFLLKSRTLATSLKNGAFDVTKI